MVDYPESVIIFNPLVKLMNSHLDTVFQALSDETRRRILTELSHGERSVTQLAEPFSSSLAAVSKHIKALENAGLVRREIRGRIHILHLEAKPLAEAQKWLKHYEQFWNKRLNKLEQLLIEENSIESISQRSKGEK